MENINFKVRKKENFLKQKKEPLRGKLRQKLKKGVLNVVDNPSRPSAGGVFPPLAKFLIE